MCVYLIVVFLYHTTVKLHGRSTPYTYKAHEEQLHVLCMFIIYINLGMYFIHQGISCC